MKINCLIIDDEPSTVELVKNFLDLFKEFKIVGVANNGVQGLNLIEHNKPDLVFMDINLPDISGIYLIKSIIHPTDVIFITGTDQYAITAYEYDVIDYILKPISLERFIKAINKYKSKFITEMLNKRIGINNKVSSIFKLKVNSKTYNLRLSEIFYFESMREFVKVHFINDEKLIVKYVLTKLDNELPDNFIRIHKSYIIAKDKIKSFTNKYVELGEIKIPIGTIYKNQVLKVLTESDYEILV